MWPHLASDDNLVEAMHMVLQEAVTYMTVSWPKPYNDRAPSEYADWPEEKDWALKTLDAARSQLVDSKRQAECTLCRGTRAGKLGG